MSGEKVVRYTAEQMRSLAFNQERCREEVSLALQQAAQTEADVARLVEALKYLLDNMDRRERFPCEGMTEIVLKARRNARSALARFQP